MDILIPKDLPKIESDCDFDPSRHLDLKEPEQVWTLKDFSYSEAQQKKAPYPIAVSSPFRLLSDEGVERLRLIVKELVQFRRGSKRMANYIRGGLYYSKFLRDFCSLKEVNDFIAKIAGAPVRPHPMALYQCHLNLMPEDPSKEVDRWHTDTVLLDYVLMLTDPQSFKGGHFEFFKTTKKEAIRSLVKEDGLPDVIKVDFPKAGYAILQQGNLVVHRANRVEEGNERTTMVQSFIPTDPFFNDVSQLDDCKLVDPPEYLYSEWSRYKALIAKEKLDHLRKNLAFTEDKNYLIQELRLAIRDVEKAVFELSDTSEGQLLHFSDDPLTGLIPE